MEIKNNDSIYGFSGIETTTTSSESEPLVSNIFLLSIKLFSFSNSLLVTFTTQLFDDNDHTSLDFDFDFDSGLIEKPLFTLTTIRLLNCLVNNSINQ